MPKFRVFWKAKGSTGQRKQGSDIIEAENEFQIDDVIEGELRRDTPCGDLKLKIVDAINLFDAGCENWEVTKIVPMNCVETVNPNSQVQPKGVTLSNCELERKEESV